MKEKLKVLICGHTGATGEALVNELIKSDYCESIVAIGRRENIKFKNSKKVTQHIVDMSNLNLVDPKIALGCNCAFCCIGTPFNDVAKKDKQDAYREVDFKMATDFAKLAKDANVTFYSTITGEGTEKESNSKINMYRVKQDVEKYVTDLNFEKIAFIRPGFLNRGEYATFTEKLMLPKFFGIPVQKVAQAMIFASLTQIEHIKGYNGNKELKNLAKEYENNY
jgi:oxidoreductase